MILIAGAVACLAQEADWRIHEWGTFTALQDESGRSIGWINTEDEPVPNFVHRLRESLLVPIDDLAPVFFKGAPRSHPDVLVRLETPVLYFHPPRGAKLPVRMDVKVEFRGGWLTEFYPAGKVSAPGLEARAAEFGRLGPATVGSLEWKGLQIGKDGSFPSTRDSVWLAPRDVNAAPVATADGAESERFVFYRGVGYLHAPLIVVRSADGGTLSIRSCLPDDLAARAPMAIPRMWLLDIRENGDMAFRTLPPVTLAKAPAFLASAPSSFPDGAFSSGNLAQVRREMKEALVQEGLHGDEAEALLNTWDASYFKSHGLRLFFLVPRAWTEYVLPLTVSPEARVTRAMIGRIEIVTPHERACLGRIAAAKECSTAWYNEWCQRHPEAVQRFYQRRREGDLGSLRRDCVKIPDDYLAYLELGRFRNALVLDDYRRNREASAALGRFIATYDLAPAAVPER